MSYIGNDFEENDYDISPVGYEFITSEGSFYSIRYPNLHKVYEVKACEFIMVEYFEKQTQEESCFRIRHIKIRNDHIITLKEYFGSDYVFPHYKYDRSPEYGRKNGGYIRVTIKENKDTAEYIYYNPFIRNEIHSKDVKFWIEGDYVREGTGEFPYFSKPIIHWMLKTDLLIEAVGYYGAAMSILKIEEDSENLKYQFIEYIQEKQYYTLSKDFIPFTFQKYSYTKDKSTWIFLNDKDEKLVFFPFTKEYLYFKNPETNDLKENNTFGMVNEVKELIYHSKEDVSFEYKEIKLDYLDFVLLYNQGELELAYCTTLSMCVPTDVFEKGKLLSYLQTVEGPKANTIKEKALLNVLQKKLTISKNK